MKQKELLALARNTNTSDLIREASIIRDKGHGSLVTYSPKVFIPLTHLCRDVCHYCTFAKTPKRISSPYMSVEEVVDSAKRAEALGCKEALFTLGERPELRYSAARKALSNMGYETTLEYLKVASQAVIDNTEILPHLNPGCMSLKEILELRKKGTTIIFSTHRMESVEEICDHIALINKSQTILEGPIEQIKKQFTNNTYEVITANKELRESDCFTIINNKKNIFQILLKEGKTQKEALQSILKEVEIVSFKKEVPSMEDIFIKAVNNA